MGHGCSAVGGINDQGHSWRVTLRTTKSGGLTWWKCPAGRSERTQPARRVAALELLFMFAADRVSTHLMDNKGNVYAASKRSAKKWPCSALMMELSAQEQKRAVFASLHHVKRLTHLCSGFNPSWILLPVRRRMSRCKKRPAMEAASPSLGWWLGRRSRGVDAYPSECGPSVVLLRPGSFPASPENLGWGSLHWNHRDVNFPCNTDRVPAYHGLTRDVGYVHTPLIRLGPGGS